MCGALAFVYSVDDFLATVAAVAAREYSWVAGYQCIRVGDNATLAVTRNRSKLPDEIA